MPTSPVHLFSSCSIKLRHTDWGGLYLKLLANIKQVLTILLAVSVFDLTITKMNAAGIVLTLIGGALYARVELGEKSNKERRSM